ncbi:MAG: 50S ribosomal protein L11 methyltransferase [Pseudomonadota bacterium]
MSADGGESWKLTLPCTRAEAEAIDFEAPALAALDPTPVLLTSEEIEDDPTRWRLDAFFEGKPDAATLAVVRALVPSAKASKAKPERVIEQDWITLSQAGIEPVHAGRFYIHTAANRGPVPPGARAFRIEASRAFGTGQHQTTSGCLVTLDGLKQRGAVFRNIADIGTGTGLLAFAALHLWPRAYATASDIDPASIDVTAENAVLNGVALGRGMGAVALAVASGLDHPLIARRAPYDLIVANILAGPLIALAPAIGAALAPGGTLVLAGLLDTQAAAVARAYRREGLFLAGRTQIGDWPTLRLRKRQKLGWRRPVRDSGKEAETPGFGSW